MGIIHGKREKNHRSDAPRLWLEKISQAWMKKRGHFIRLPPLERLFLTCRRLRKCVSVNCQLKLSVVLWDCGGGSSSSCDWLKVSEELSSVINKKKKRKRNPRQPSQASSVRRRSQGGRRILSSTRDPHHGDFLRFADYGMRGFRRFGWQQEKEETCPVLFFVLIDN